MYIIAFACLAWNSVEVVLMLLTHLFHIKLLNCSGVVLFAYPASFFKVVFSTGFFHDPAWIFRFSHTRPPCRWTLLTEIFLHGSHHGFMCSLTRIFYFVASKFFFRVFSLVILTWASPHSNFYKSVKLDFYDFSCLMFKNEGWNDCDAKGVDHLPPSSTCSRGR